MTLDELTNAAKREQELRDRARAAYQAGKITKEEYEYFMREELGVEPAKRPGIQERRKAVATRALLFLLGIALLFSLSSLLHTGESDGLTTGMITADVAEVQSEQHLLFTESALIPLNITETTLLRLTGLLENGSANASLLVDDEERLVYAGAATQGYGVTTDKEEYALNETITVGVRPEKVNYTLWLSGESGEKRLVSESFALEEPGEYTLDALIDDKGEAIKESTAFTVLNSSNATGEQREAAGASLLLEEECVETCLMNSTGKSSLLLEISLSEGARLTIDYLTITQPRENQAPVQVAELPDLELEAGEEATLDLDAYFTDPDNESLTYDYMNAAGVAMSVEDEELTITGLSPGESESLIYAADLATLIESNTFTITVTPAEEASEPPGEENESAPQANATIPENETTELPRGLCNHPDPNKRPIECLQDEEQYFLPQEVVIEDGGRKIVGKLTPIGNLLIAGEVHEESAFTPRPGDYQVSRELLSGERVATIWFESATGDLWLNGRLYEANNNLEPPRGAYVLKNKRGIILAWADVNTGDLHVRGNIITGRELR